MLQEEVDMVSDDFNSVPEGSPDLQFDSTLEEPVQEREAPSATRHHTFVEVQRDSK